MIKATSAYDISTLKLHSDPIVEAVFEIRFETSELSEKVVGRLIDIPLFSDFEFKRLPGADIPESIRASDLNIKYQPTLEGTEISSHSAVRVGPHSFSYSMYAPYSGWSIYCEKLNELLASIFETLLEININRIGLRYVNVLTASSHNIGSISELDLTLVIGDKCLSDDFHVNYVTNSETHNVMTRVASPKFIKGGDVSQDTIAVIDIDVFTSDIDIPNNQASVKAWLEEAHDLEKNKFFQLFTDNMIANLEERST
jgi:uncharacterized protein (TIGR04255 family)